MIDVRVSICDASRDERGFLVHGLAPEGEVGFGKARNPFDAVLRVGEMGPQASSAQDRRAKHHVVPGWQNTRPAAMDQGSQPGGDKPPERQTGMGLQREPDRGRLYPVGGGQPTDFPGKQSLFLRSANMFDHAVREDNVERVVGELAKPRGVTVKKGEVMVACDILLSGNPGEINDGDVERRSDMVPDFGSAAEIKYALPDPRGELGLEAAHARTAKIG